MNAKEYLENYKKDLEPLLRGYFENKKRNFKKIDPLADEAMRAIEKFTMSGGKRIRPAMVYYGFLLGGGEADKKNKKNILQASMAMELIHSFLLIHDDIIDRDKKRHGVDTMHEYYKKVAEKFFPKTDKEHFGNSMAIIAGDLAASMANEILFESNFSSDVILKALRQLQKVVYTTIPGEMLDVVMEARGKSTESEILKMHEGKTAFYTFEGPLHLGIILASNNSEKLLRNISDYSMAVGKAFQIRDDILGVFGDEKKLGKPIGSDIIESKQTLLVIKVLENGNEEQKEIIRGLLGKKDLSSKELESFRKVVIETGALKYSEDLARKFSKDSFEMLENIDSQNFEAKDFLGKIAEYTAVRNC
ncbi:MAG: polyprenyl synthetase family protein [Candidatus Moranbacteria bacterium]|nr:polyprenyl synthetase family protein [Candidatus Moranbacteria bacterium]